jgi:methylmalonyl-CoA mutase N-terminal domain/subunit
VFSAPRPRAQLHEKPAHGGAFSTLALMRKLRWRRQLPHKASGCMGKGFSRVATEAVGQAMVLRGLPSQRPDSMKNSRWRVRAASTQTGVRGAFSTVATEAVGQAMVLRGLCSQHPDSMKNSRWRVRAASTQTGVRGAFSTLELMRKLRWPRQLPTKASGVNA